MNRRAFMATIGGVVAGAVGAKYAGASSLVGQGEIYRLKSIVPYTDQYGRHWWEVTWRAGGHDVADFLAATMDSLRYIIAVNGKRWDRYAPAIHQNYNLRQPEQVTGRVTYEIKGIGT